MTSNQPPIERLRQLARIYSRRPEEVDDLVQDVLLEAVRKQRDFSSPSFINWARGVMRKHAAFVARTAGRRRKREAASSSCEGHSSNVQKRFPPSFVEGLRPSTRMVARLLNCGLNRSEIAFVLGIADTALRQRLTALRREWNQHVGGGGEGPEIVQVLDRPFVLGLMRRSLREAFHTSANREFGSHDPDGHLFIIRPASTHKRQSDGNNKEKQPTYPEKP